MENLVEAGVFIITKGLVKVGIVQMELNIGQSRKKKVELLTKYDKELLTRVALEIKNVRYITFSKENETYNRAIFITKNGFSFGYNFLNLYFKNLEFDKKYTLAELGLEVEE